VQGSFVPDGTGLVGWTSYPALKRWAIFGNDRAPVAHPPSKPLAN
jgi:hypothetical protein